MSITELDFSIKNSYYSQINNKYMPLEACMPTSFIMALIYNTIPVIEAGSHNLFSFPCFVYPIESQPEDFLMALCRSPWGIALRDAIPWAKNDNIPPNQVHAVISEIINKMVGLPVTKFMENQTIDQLIAEVHARRPVVVSGSFTRTGHALVVCGMRLEGDTVTHLLVDDPYGDYNKGYKEKNGNNVWFEIEEFKKHWAGWFHRFNRNGV